MLAQGFDVRRVVFLNGVKEPLQPLSRRDRGTGAVAIRGTILSTTPAVALPSAPLELSMPFTAGESFSSSSTAPSPAIAGSVRATRSISPTASFRRSTALRVPLHPNPLRRKLALKAQG